MEPNAFTISSFLKACKCMESYICGVMVHGLANKHGINGSLYVEHTLMDMYATCKDSMDAAWLVFETIQVKNSVSWTTMSVGYMNRGDGYAAVRMLRRMLQQGPVLKEKPVTTVEEALVEEEPLLKEKPPLRELREESQGIGNAIRDSQGGLHRAPSVQDRLREFSSANRDLHRWKLRLGSRPRFYSYRYTLLLIKALQLPRQPGVGCTL
ncbi:hypothetical protein Scep_021985 [Stephania cephalantha]|uniref:Pentatricopeptide repeat-containing protein n=1 Tax=Stephania cephalantha TaxID=152367 RepID=A0AAP0F4H0_9MAGN